MPNAKPLDLPALGPLAAVATLANVVATTAIETNAIIHIEAVHIEAVHIEAEHHEEVVDQIETHVEVHVDIR